MSIQAIEAIQSKDRNTLIRFLSENGYGHKWMISNARVNNLKALVWAICELKYPEVFKD